MRKLIKKISLLLAAIMIINLCPVQAHAAVKLNKTKCTIYLGDTVKLKINSSNVKWSSSNKGVASVTAAGKVTANKTGTATITARVRSKSGSYKAYKCQVTVREKYGVFIGLTKLDYKRMGKYDAVVIDAEYFTKTQIKKLRKAGCRKVYSYLNVGSLEDFRDYYDDYKDLAMGEYENWPGEYWMDISSKRWQDFCIARSKTLMNKGIDGLFIDNCDVYYLYPKKGIFNGLVTTLSGMKKTGARIIINGGDAFVSKCISLKKKGIIDAVNQESVYTAIDFDHNRFFKNKDSERKYFTNYLKKVKKAGIDIYVLEYATDPAIAKAARKYSKKNGWKVYVSPLLELK